MRVLIADDSRVMRKIFRHALESMEIAGSDIFETADGGEAASFLDRKGTAIDLVIVDWDLPVLNGPTLHRLVRGADATRSLKVLFAAGRHDRVAYEKDDDTDVVERPFTDEMLQGKVRRMEESIKERKSQASANLLKNVVLAAEADLPFLIRLPSKLIDAFLKHARKERHAAGATLVSSGDTVDHFHVLTAGEVEIVDGSGKVVQVCGDGDTFGEMSFMLNQPSSVTARAKTAVETASVSRIALGDLVRVHPSLSDHLSGLMAGRWRKTGTTRITRPESELMGNLASMPFSDVVQLLHVTQKTGTLNLKEDMRAGSISFRGGEVVHAWADDLTGEEAFYRIATWRNARFAFTSATGQDAHTLDQPTMSLLMEAMRRLDESSS